MRKLLEKLKSYGVVSKVFIISIFTQIVFGRLTFLRENVNLPKKFWQISILIPPKTQIPVTKVFIFWHVKNKCNFCQMFFGRLTFSRKNGEIKDFSCSRLELNEFFRKNWYYKLCRKFSWSLFFNTPHFLKPFKFPFTKVFSLSIFTGKCQSAKKKLTKITFIFFMSNNKDFSDRYLCFWEI